VSVDAAMMETYFGKTIISYTILFGRGYQLARLVARVTFEGILWCAE